MTRTTVLLDTNLIIYGASAEDLLVKAFVATRAIACSAASMVETLGSARLTVQDGQRLRRFFDFCNVLPIDEEVIEGAIDLRQRQKMSLGDSLIAATAIAHGLTLATRNVDDFAWIDELEIVNPYAGA